MEGKKISFGFMKTKKVDKPIVEEKKEFIECVEEKYIKVVGGEEVKENTPLVIPMKPNTLVTAERLKEIAEKVESVLDENEPENKPQTIAEKIPENETLEQMAVRELMEEAKKEVKVETQKITVPLPGICITEGQKESTLEDYESVPIQEFGLAMLRGMGWTPNKEASKYKQPQLRPKGLGLGADKMVKENQKQKSSSNKDNNKDEELSIVKNAFVKITTGKHSGYYGKVVSLDEDNGRVMVDITVQKTTVSLSEFMMHPVTRTEYERQCKVVNANSYDEYKKKEMMSNHKRNSKSSTSNNDRDMDNSRSRDDTSVSRSKHNGDSDRTNRDYSRDKYSRSKNRTSSGSESDSERTKYKKKDSKVYSSNESLSADDKKKYKKRNKRYSCSETDSEPTSTKHETSDGKRDIDKKRKGKKKKRDRDRSPNHRKHKK